MDLEAFDELACSLPGVRRTTRDGLIRWQVGGRLVARQLDATHVVVRVPFDVRDLLQRRSPEVFSVPSRLVKHMSVVADLAAAGAGGAGGAEGADHAGSDGGVEDAVTSAWRLQVDGTTTDVIRSEGHDHRSV